MKPKKSLIRSGNSYYIKGCKRMLHKEYKFQHSKADAPNIQINSIKILENLTLVLENIIKDSEAKNLEEFGFTRECEVDMFNSFSNHKLPLKSYVKRICKYLNPEVSSFVISLILIDRLISSKARRIQLTQYNVHKFFLIALLIAIKYNEDEYFDNQYYGKVTGIPLIVLNSLELKFCELINFKIFITQKLYKQYSRHLKYY